MTIENAVKENTNTTVECQANSANPASYVDMEFFIGATKQSHIAPQINTTPGSDNGMLKTFAFTFATDRKQNGMVAKCHVLWDGNSINETIEDYLSITC